jgi:hypothetical protein
MPRKLSLNMECVHCLFLLQKQVGEDFRMVQFIQPFEAFANQRSGPTFLAIQNLWKMYNQPLLQDPKRSLD